MIVQCTTAELPSLLPMLARLKSAFKLDVTDAPKETATVTAQPATTEAVTSTATEPRWYSTEEVRVLFKYKTIQSAIDLMKRAGIEAIRVRKNGQRGKAPHYYDANKVDALKRDYDDTLGPKDAASLMGDKTVLPIHYHTEHRRVTPTLVAGKARYRLDDLAALMKLRDRA